MHTFSCLTLTLTRSDSSLSGLLLLRVSCAAADLDCLWCLSKRKLNSDILQEIQLVLCVRMLRHACSPSLAAYGSKSDKAKVAINAQSPYMLQRPDAYNLLLPNTRVSMRGNYVAVYIMPTVLGLGLFLCDEDVWHHRWGGGVVRSQAALERWNSIINFACVSLPSHICFGVFEVQLFRKVLSSQAREAFK